MAKVDPAQMARLKAIVAAQNPIAAKLQRLREASETNYSVSVKQGEYQISIVRYRKNGSSIIEPVSGFLNPATLHERLDELLAAFGEPVPTGQPNR